MKLVIVGGVAGGASAAARARRLSEEAEIVVFERGPDVSFANCGLPYYIGGEIRDRGKLLVTRPEVLRQRYRLDVRTETEVIKIDRVAPRSRPAACPTVPCTRSLMTRWCSRRGGSVAAADSGHRSAGRSHPAKPGRRGPDQGRRRSGREQGHSGRRRVHRVGAGREPAAARGPDRADRAPGPGLTTARCGVDHAHGPGTPGTRRRALAGRLGGAVPGIAGGHCGRPQVGPVGDGPACGAGRGRAAREPACRRRRPGGWPPGRHPGQRPHADQRPRDLRGG